MASVAHATAARTARAAQHGMIWVTLGQLPCWQTSLGSAEDENCLASFLGFMAQSNADQGPEEAPPASDRATAERFRRRIGEAAHRWGQGPGGCSGRAIVSGWRRRPPASRGPIRRPGAV